MEYGVLKKLDSYKFSKSIEDWRKFRNVVKKTKHMFFDIKIQEIVAKRYSLWKLMNWVKKCKLLAIKSIQHDG